MSELTSKNAAAPAGPLQGLEMKLNQELQQVRSKLLVNHIGSRAVSYLVISLNLTTIMLSLAAIILLGLEISADNTKLTSNVIIMPLIVASFTILLFGISVSLLVYTSKTKVNLYDQQAQMLQYLILQLNHQDQIDLPAVIAVFNDLQLQEAQQNSKLNYRHLLTSVLEQKHAKK